MGKNSPFCFPLLNTFDMKKYLGLLTVAALLTTACHTGHKHDHDHDHEHDHDHAQEHQHGEQCDHQHEEEGEHANEISFSKAQAEAVGLQVETVAPGSFPEVIKTSGQVLSAQGDEVTVVATSNGTVSFDKRFASEGASIQAGQTILTISGEKLLEGDPALKAKIAFETAEKEFQRAEKLIKDQIISAKEYEQIRLTYETAKAGYKAQAGQIGASGVRVNAPINGYIKNRLVAQGEYVSVGQAIAIVAQNKRLQLKADVPENYYPSLRIIQSAHFRPSYTKEVYRLSDLNGRVLSYGKTAGQESYFIPFTFEFDNIGDILPGAYAEVYLLSTPLENVLSVPVSAVTEEQGLYFVYLQLEDEVFKKQEVGIGHNNGRRIQVVSGLKAGDKVVAQGVYQVKLAANSSVIPEGHSHSH